MEDEPYSEKRIVVLTPETPGSIILTLIPYCFSWFGMILFISLLFIVKVSLVYIVSEGQDLACLVHSPASYSPWNRVGTEIRI